MQKFDCPAEVSFEIGRIFGVYEMMKYLRRKHKDRFKEAKLQLMRARADLDSFGMYDDCGPSYEAAYARAQGEYLETEEQLRLYISTQKYFRKLKHLFREQHPEYVPVLEAYLESQASALSRKPTCTTT